MADLLDGADLLLVDLDGVVYLGTDPVEHASQALNDARDRGRTVRFLTNNASRTPEQVRDRITATGARCDPDDVLTSAVATAELLALDTPPGSAVLVVGGDGLRKAVTGVGLRPVERAEDEPVVVVQGFAPHVDWQALAEASVAVRRGARWVATNLDLTVPSPRGQLPGNGSLVATVRTATGVTPESVGKPGPAMYQVALSKLPDARPLAVGDRLDTDIAGAVAAGIPSLLVLTGVTGAADLLDCPEDARPTYVGSDLRALTLSHPQPVDVDGGSGGGVRCGGAVARVDGGQVRVEDSGEPATPDGLDPLRALNELVWRRGADPAAARDALETVGK
jgi:glycerol-1-phosphatase